MPFQQNKNGVRISLFVLSAQETNIIDLTLWFTWRPRWHSNPRPEGPCPGYENWNQRNAVVSHNRTETLRVLEKSGCELGTRVLSIKPGSVHYEHRSNILCRYLRPRLPPFATAKSMGVEIGEVHLSHQHVSNFDDAAYRVIVESSIYRLELQRTRILVNNFSTSNYKLNFIFIK